jgi:hypothetical protein
MASNQVGVWRTVHAEGVDGLEEGLLADPRVVYWGAKPLSSRIMRPWRGSRS